MVCIASGVKVSVDVGYSVLVGGVVDVGHSVGADMGGSGVGVVVINLGVFVMGVSVGVVIVSVGTEGVLVSRIGVEVALGRINVGVADGSGDGVRVSDGVKLGRMGATFGTWSF